MNDSIRNVPKHAVHTDPKFVQAIKLGKPLDYSSKGLRTLNSKSTSYDYQSNISYYWCNNSENCVFK